MNEDTAIGAQTADESFGTQNAAGAQSPYCREIRSKRYFFLRGMPTEERHLKDGSNHCWCRSTMKVYGPDGELARPADCVSGRACYRSLFDAE